MRKPPVSGIGERFINAIGSRFSPACWSDGDLEAPLLSHWKRIVHRYPRTAALRESGHQITYQELDRISSLIASRIGELTKDPSEVISISTDQGIEGVIAIVAVLKSSHPFVFLSPEDSEERRELIAGISGTRILLTNSGGSTLPRSEELSVIPLDLPNLILRSRKRMKRELPPPRANHDLAIVFTSGMSGKPSGVRRSQRSQLHLVRHLTRRCGIGPGDRIAMVIPPSFGACLNDIFLALLSGATLCPFPLSREGAARLGEWLIREEISYLHCVPTVFRSLLRHDPDAARRMTSLRWFKIGGETLSPDDISRLFSTFPPNVGLIYSYGSTETGGTISDRVYTQAPAGNEPASHVGRPIPGKEVLIVDPEGAILPPGTEGEIVVRSRYLASGYFRDEEKTELRFRETGSGSVWFFTRDLGILECNGTLRHSGRRDGHLKLRGIRIDPAEIETHLCRHPSITEAAVIVSREGSELVAFLVCPETGGKVVAGLRESVSRTLPRGISPNRFIPLESLPYLPNGKINREALAGIAVERRENTETKSDVAPRNELETIIAEIWCRLLNRTSIGIYDDFFELGGDSLIAMNFQADVSKQIGLDLPLSLLLGANPTIAHVAEQIGHASPCTPGDSLHSQPSEKSFPPLAILRAEGEGRPVVFLPGGYGTEAEMMWFARISPAIDHRHPVCGFIASKIYQLDPPPNSVKELAKQYLAALKRQFPGRAPIVVGHCIAGPVAHEMALQLSGESQGSFPDLILIESASRRGWFRHLRELDGDMAPSPSHPEFIRHYLSILDSFVPGIYPWRISLLLSETSRKHRDATLGWNMCAIEAIDLIPIPGDHHEAIRDYREELGTILHGVIDQIPR